MGKQKILKTLLFLSFTKIKTFKISTKKGLLLQYKTPKKRALSQRKCRSMGGVERIRTPLDL
jgi:hypothetical protein